MENNKLAAILEASLKKENLIEPEIPQPPLGPKSPPKKKIFEFSEKPNEAVFAAKGGTPKFSEEKKAEKSQEKKIVSGFFKPASKIGHKVMVEDSGEDKTPDILFDDEFEIDGMGEVWEYAGHSANVNNKEDSESDSDEFDPHGVVKVVKREVKKNVVNELGVNKAEVNQGVVNITDKKTIKKPKRVDLQTRKLMAEAKIQQASMKMPEKLPEVQIEQPQVIVNVSNEWDNISVREIEEVKIEKVQEFEYFNRNVCVNEVLQSIESIQVDIQPSPKKSFFRGFFSCFRVKSRTRSAIAGQKQRIQKFSQQSFDKANNMHVSMLKKIYILLRNSDHCPLIGEHWKEIGFQGKSPETDLRKTGMFGLLSILYFIEKHHKAAEKIHKISLEAQTRFPFASVCLNFADVTLEALEQNTLIKEIEKTERVYEVLLDYFCGLMIYWIQIFTGNKNTVMDIMSMKDVVAAHGKKNVNEILSFVRNNKV